MELGKKIRALRLQQNLTQEQLAKELNVTAQAVSKWENDSTTPDIQLLPQLSVQLGVTIDELFAMSDEAHFERLDRMLNGEAFLSRGDFDRVMAFLKDRCANPALEAECLNYMAAFCNHRADGYRKKAEYYAKQALELEPEEKANHSQLNMATQSSIWDWNCINHHEQIAWYYKFMEKNPGFRMGYLWLADLLVTDGRLKEAAWAIDKMEALGESYHIPLYRGHIALKTGGFEEAERCWKEMTETYPDNWLTWSCLGDAYAKQARYDEALVYYRKATELEKKPRYYDNWECIGHICEILKDTEGAVDAYRHVMEICMEDWGADPKGESVRKFERKIQKLAL